MPKSSGFGGQDRVVNIHPVDPRDVEWEVDKPRYRIHFVDGGSSHWDEYEVGEVDIDDVLSWADEHSDGRAYAVLVMVVAPGGTLGSVRLLSKPSSPGR